MITTSDKRSAPVIDTSSISGFGKVLLLQHLGGAVYTTSAQEGHRLIDSYVDSSTHRLTDSWTHGLRDSWTHRLIDL